MVNIKETVYNQYKIYSIEDTAMPPVEPSTLIDRFFRATLLEKKGRGGIKLLTINNQLVACRKYIHGGLFRIITRDIFFSGKRATEELEIMFYLMEKGFPVVQPYGLIIGRDFVTKNLYILTVFEENAMDLLDVLKGSPQRERYRIIKQLARLMWDMETLGVYHPDLHLNNVLITTDKEMKFLDFDRAYRKPINKKDMERMFWRLNRYVEKMKRTKKVKIALKEKMLFLSIYRKLSGFDMARQMEDKANRKGFLSRLGWFFESLIYRGQGSRGKGQKASEIRKPKKTQNAKLPK